MHRRRDSQLTRCLGLFAKNWKPGEVKTRLAQTIGDEKAAAIYRAFVEALAVRFAELQGRKVLAYSPDNDAARTAFSASEFREWTLDPQCGDDLGSRMSAFFDSQLQAGCQSVVLLGTDCPNIPLAAVQQAFTQLASNEVVLGPSEDGGYYLIGVSRRVPPIFDDMPWSTPELWQATISKLADAGIRYSVLQPWYDVDEMHDLTRLIEDLGAIAHSDAVLLKLQREIDLILESE